MRTATAVAVLATAACTRYVSGPPTTVAPTTNTQTAAQASPTATSASAAPTTTATVELQPGPHSAIADVDLPEGTVPCTTAACTDLPNNPHEEYWRYSASYDDVVAFLRKRFATGRRYDTHGATWWNGLPPCYDTKHQSPPWGSTYDDSMVEWVWSDDAMMLLVDVQKPNAAGVVNPLPFGRIAISKIFDLEGLGPCYRA